MDKAAMLMESAKLIFSEYYEDQGEEVDLSKMDYFLESEALVKLIQEERQFFSNQVISIHKLVWEFHGKVWWI